MPARVLKNVLGVTLLNRLHVVRSVDFLRRALGSVARLTDLEAVVPAGELENVLWVALGLFAGIGDDDDGSLELVGAVENVGVVIGDGDGAAKGEGGILSEVAGVAVVVALIDELGVSVGRALAHCIESGSGGVGGSLDCVAGLANLEAIVPARLLENVLWVALVDERSGRDRSHCNGSREDDSRSLHDDQNRSCILTILGVVSW